MGPGQLSPRRGDNPIIGKDLGETGHMPKGFFREPTSEFNLQLSPHRGRPGRGAGNVRLMAGIREVASAGGHHPGGPNSSGRRKSPVQLSHQPSLDAAVSKRRPHRRPAPPLRAPRAGRGPGRCMAGKNRKQTIGPGPPEKKCENSLDSKVYACYTTIVAQQVLLFDSPLPREDSHAAKTTVHIG